MAAPFKVVPRMERKDKDSRAAEAGVQVITSVSVKEGGTGRVKRACTAE